MSKERTLLAEALEIIENPRNWTTEQLEEEWGDSVRYCAIGAIEEAHSRHWFWFDPRKQHLCHAIDILSFLGMEGAPVEVYNDLYGRSNYGHTRVVEAFRRALAALDGKRVPQEHEQLVIAQEEELVVAGD